MSVNAGFSFLGIMLGVATLIVVMAVMNVFRKDLLDKILGFNRYLSIESPRQPLTDWDAFAQRLALLRGIKLAVPTVAGKALAAFTAGGEGVVVRGIRGQDLRKLDAISLISINIEWICHGLAWLGIHVFPPEVYLLSRLPADMNVGETVMVVLMALALSLLATLYPSWQAARLDPVEALRYE